MNRSKRIFLNIALSVVSILVSIIIAELALRVFYPPIGTSFLYRIPHKTFGWKLQPEVDYVNQLPEASIRVKYNSGGWRDTEHEVERKTPEVFRILVLGDSFMEGYSVELEDSFHKRLESLISNAGTNVETINLGVGGYGTLQEYLAYREIGADFKPNLVLLGFYLGNDLQNNSHEFKTKSDRIKSNRPYLDLTIEDRWVIVQSDFEESLKKYNEQQDWLKQLKNNFALYHAIKNLNKKIKFLIRDNSVEVSNIERLEQFGPNFCTEQPEFSRAWAVTERILRRLNLDIINNGGKLVVFSVPALHEIDKKLIDRLDAESSGNDKICLADSPSYLHLEKLLSNLHIDYINLLPEFRKTSDGAGSKLFHLSDRHWNKYGHSLAAEQVYEYLGDSGLITTK